MAFVVLGMRFKMTLYVDLTWLYNALTKNSKGWWFDEWIAGSRDWYLAMKNNDYISYHNCDISANMWPLSLCRNMKFVWSNEIIMEFDQQKLKGIESAAMVRIV